MSRTKFGTKTKTKNYRTKSPLIKKWESIEKRFRNANNDLEDLKEAIKGLDEKEKSYEVELDVLETKLYLKNLLAIRAKEAKRIFLNFLNRKEKKKIKRYSIYSIKV